MAPQVRATAQGGLRPSARSRVRLGGINSSSGGRARSVALAGPGARRCRPSTLPRVQASANRPLDGKSLHRPDKTKLAVLIDGDNASASVVQPLLVEVAKYGVATVKRIYGDWTKLQNRPWKDNLLKHSIQPIQQFQYTTGKNSTDSSLIIDAMDLLHAGNVDGFCLVSSDSDFTRLASRLREDGHLVIGIGEKKTPEPFVHSCDKFIYTEYLRPRRDQAPRHAAASANVSQSNDATPTSDMGVLSAKRNAHGSNSSSSSEAPRACGRKGEVSASSHDGCWSQEELLADSKLMDTLRSAIEDSAAEDGWANLGSVSTVACLIMPEFDCRMYGYKRLSHLIMALDTEFELSPTRVWVKMISDHGGQDLNYVI